LLFLSHVHCAEGLKRFPSGTSHRHPALGKGAVSIFDQQQMISQISDLRKKNNEPRPSGFRRSGKPHPAPYRSNPARRLARELKRPRLTGGVESNSEN
jgi:hypothetical protein